MQQMGARQSPPTREHAMRRNQKPVMKATPFTPDMDTAFAGAEDWPNGDRPVFRVIGPRMIIACRDRVECHDVVGLPNDRTTIVFSMLIDFPTQASARFFINAMNSATDVRALGFTQIN